MHYVVHSGLSFEYLQKVTNKNIGDVEINKKSSRSRCGGGRWTNWQFFVSVREAASKTHTYVPYTSAVFYFSTFYINTLT